MDGNGNGKERITITIDPEVLAWLDTKRESISRSAYINLILRKQREIMSSNL